MRPAADQATLHDCRRRAAAEQGAILLESSQAAGRTLFFSEPVHWFEASTLHEVEPLLHALQQAVERGLWVAGYLSYECGYALEPRSLLGALRMAEEGLPLAAFGVYHAPQVLPGRLAAAGRSAAVEGLRLGIGEAAFAAKIARIHAWIEAGDTYQVNLTDGMEGVATSAADALFAAMMEAQPVAYGALLRVGAHTILSASPELFFHLRDRQITVRPMKGTAPRGRDMAEDAACADALATDPKNRAENLMIVDLMRSDLGRIAVIGSVRVEQLFGVERYPSLLQLTSSVTAELRPRAGLWDVFASLFPSGSVTGAPRIRTMQIIRELEARDRGVYTGAIGYWSPQGEAMFSVAIRTAVLQGSRLRMGVGCGITYDSDARAEYAECLLKGRFLEEPTMRLIESIRCEDGRCALLALHLDRLADSAAYFGFTLDRAALQAALHARAAQQPAGVWKLRLELDRLGQAHWSEPERIAATGRPLRFLLATEPVSASERLLRHKTTRREIYARALTEARAAGCDEAVLMNTRGELTEGAVHNLLVRHGACWRTPPVDCGLLPGVFRRHLLATMPALREAVLRPEDLRTADEIWLTNALHGARPAHWASGDRLE